MSRTERSFSSFAVVTAVVLAGPAHAGIIASYTVDAGGSNGNPLNGLSAQASFQVDGFELTIVLTNTSSGVPMGAEVSDSLLVSLGFNLPDGTTIVSGDAAVIAAGSNGLGTWSGLGAGDSVAEEWLWTNGAGGDLLQAFSQIISTSMGQGGGTTTGFDGTTNPNVNGPFGGMAASPVLVGVPDTQMAVSDSIEFRLTLSSMLSNGQLQTLADDSVVEFGSDYQYLAVPGPAVLPVLAVLLVGRRRRR